MPQIKEVRFVMLLTDDSLQDEWAVICAKKEVYEKHLPSHIKKVIFVADGASCFSSKIHRAIQSLWNSWTGVDETVYRITVAGGGKSSLDGMFGRFSSCLSTAVDSGMEYRDATGVVGAMEYDGGGLTATEVGIFEPGRNEAPRIYSLADGVELEGVLRSELLPDRSGLRLFRHSGFGGFDVPFTNFALYLSKSSPSDLSNNAKRTERVDADHEGVLSKLCAKIAEFCVDDIEIIQYCIDEAKKEAKSIKGKSKTDRETKERVESEIAEMEEKEDLFFAVHYKLCLCLARPFRQQLREQLAAPKLKKAVHYGSNRKSGIRSTSDSTEEDRRGTIQQKRKKSHTERREEKLEAEVQSIRGEKISAGLFLCGARCPLTNRYCRCDFLSQNALDRHTEKDTHDFPKGFSTKTKIAMILSQAGGALASGSLPDRLARSVTVNATEMPRESLGSQDAICRGKFNRPPKKKPYYKPTRLVEELTKLFDHRPVLTPHQAWMKLRAMRETDGSRTFSVGQAGSVKALGDGEVCPGCGLNPCTGCRGKLIAVESVKAYFSTLAQKRKKDAVRTKRLIPEDGNEAAAAASAGTSTGAGGSKKAAGKKKKTVTKKATTAKTKKKPSGKKKK